VREDVSIGLRQSKTLTAFFMLLRSAASMLVLILSTVSAVAKSWHGIVPLRSTRSDVRRQLGKPLIPDGRIELFEGETGHIQIMYARKPCEIGLPADWGNWNVPQDTVVNITVTLNRILQLSDLRLRNLKKMKWYTDSSGATYYHDAIRGIEYQVEGDLVTAITYGPAATDKRFRCKANAPRLKY
jgi:hypothetical protein